MLDKLKPVKNLSFKNQILADIVLMQQLRTEEIFQRAVDFFFEKWDNKSQEIDTFLAYFRSEKIEKHSAWYMAKTSGHWCPINTNEVKNFNQAIKDQHRFRERWPMNKFCEQILNIVQSWSYDRNCEFNPNATVFQTLPVITLELWKESYAFVKVLKRLFYILFYLSQLICLFSNLESWIIC